MTDLSNITENLNQINPEDIANIKLQIQNLNDTISGGLRSANIKEYRNTYVINAQDSLDASYPMYIHFNIIPEMVKIVSINVSFWFLNFRAYSTAASSGGAVSSASGGGSTPTSSAGGAQTSSAGGAQTSSAGGAQTSSAGGAQTSSATGSASGGGSTSGAIGSISYLSTYVSNEGGIDYLTLNTGSLSAGRLYTSGGAYNLENHTHTTPNHTHPTHTHTVADHTHTVADHTHTVIDHTHTVIDHTHTVTIAAHTHTGGAHTHGITYGIFEDSTSPTVMLYVSRDNGLTYSLPTGSYTTNQENLDITALIDTVGGKLIKFTSNARTRLSVQITIKLDISAR